MTLSPNHQDLQQKVSRCIGGAQSNSLLQTLIFVVEGYYSSDSSSGSLKKVFESKTEVEYSRAFVNHDNKYKQLGGGDGFHKGHAGKIHKRDEEKEARIKLQEEKIASLTRKLEKRPS